MNYPTPTHIQQPQYETQPVEDTPRTQDILFRLIMKPVLAELPADIEAGFIVLDTQRELGTMAVTHYEPDATGADQIPHTD